MYGDSQSGHLGPLAGVLTLLENAGDADVVFTTTVDCPLIPNDVIYKLLPYMVKGVDIVRVKSNDRHHPVIALWRVGLKGDLRNALVNQGIRKVDDFTKCFKVIDVEFKNAHIDVFFNINRESDIKIYKELTNN